MASRHIRIKHLLPFFGLGLFMVALAVLYHQLHAYHLRDILLQVHRMPTGHLWTAVMLTLGSYLVMTGYDILALRYIRHPLPVAKSALTAFLGYAFSNNIGFSMIAGASVRFRLYSAWGLNAVEITQVVLFCTTSTWLGFLGLSGTVFSLEHLALPQALHWPVSTLRPLGIGFLVLVGFYFAAIAFGKKEWKIREWHFSLPSPGLAVFQMAVAAADWFMAAMVLYSLLPVGTPMGFAYFLEIYLLAQLVGLISQVPGGLGVFESMMLLLIPGAVSTPQMLGTLVVFRGIYYLLPLLVATVFLGVEELLRQRRLFKHIQSLAGSAAEALFIPLLSLVVFVAGAILMFSGALPAVPQRLDLLEDIVPLPFLEISHFIGSLAGMGLLFLARGLYRRLDAAYLLTVGLLGFGIIASLLKGIDYEEAIILGLILAVLLPCRRFFFRQASLLSERFTVGWSAAVAVVLIASIALGFFAFRHVEYNHELWWHFSIKGDAPRFLRATVGSLALVLGFGLAKLLRSAPYKPPDTGPAIPEAVLPILQTSASAGANLALLGDKRFLLDDTRQAFIMYGVTRKTWVAMGDPVGPKAHWRELLWQFHRLADHQGDRAVFYEVGHEHLYLYLDMGLNLLKMGEEARVPLSSFSLAGSRRKGLRYSHRKLSKQGCSFQIVHPPSTMAHMETLKAISDAWLEHKNTREKGFSLGFFNPDYLARFSMALVLFQDRIVAFANVWQSGGHEELSVDLMRYRQDAPGGVMDYLLVELMLWGSAQGFQWFNLGMAPMSGLSSDETAPLWHRLGHLVARFGDHFYNFQGLRAYKDKFDPVWQPRYLALNAGLSLPRTLADMGALVSGGLKGLIHK